MGFATSTGSCTEWTGAGYCPYCGQSYHRQTYWIQISQTATTHPTYVPRFEEMLARFEKLTEEDLALRAFLFHVQKFTWARRAWQPVRGARRLRFTSRRAFKGRGLAPRSGRPRQRVVGLNYRKASQ